MALVQRKDRSTLIRDRPVLFSDLDINFSKTSGVSDVLRYVHEDSVKNSIKNIVLTDRTERFFNANFGCDIRRMLFENMEPSSETAIKSLIEDAIENFEPRAQLISVIVSAQEELNAYSITVVFNTINSTEHQTLDLILTRVR